MQRALVAVLLVASGCGDSAHETAVTDAAPADTAQPDDGSTTTCLPPMTMCGDTCTNLASDASNCGTCGHTCGCGSTTCTAGLCDAHVLADQQSDPLVIAYNAGNLYWDNNIQANSTSLMTMPANGSVAAKPLYAGRTAIRGFAFDATRIYFTRNVFNIVESGTLAGTSSGNFTNAQENGANGIVSDGVNVFWTNASPNGANPSSIRRASVGAPVQPGTTLVSAQAGADAIAIDATNVYWTINDPVNGEIHRVPKAGGSESEMLTKQAHPHSIAVTGGFVYWANQGDGVNKNGSINRIPVTGGVPTTLAPGLSLPMTIAVNGDSIFWTDALDGTVSKLPLAGGTAPQIIVAREAAPNGLALSPTCLYFTDEGNKAAGAGSIRAHDLR